MLMKFIVCKHRIIVSDISSIYGGSIILEGQEFKWHTKELAASEATMNVKY